MRYHWIKWCDQWRIGSKRDDGMWIEFGDPDPIREIDIDEIGEEIVRSGIAPRPLEGAPTEGQLLLIGPSGYVNADVHIESGRWDPHKFDDWVGDDGEPITCGWPAPTHYLPMPRIALPESDADLIKRWRETQEPSAATEIANRLERRGG